MDMLHDGILVLIVLVPCNCLFMYFLNRLSKSIDSKMGNYKKIKMDILRTYGYQVVVTQLPASNLILSARTKREQSTQTDIISEQREDHNKSLSVKPSFISSIKLSQMIA